MQTCRSSQFHATSGWSKKGAAKKVKNNRIKTAQT